MPQTAPVVSTQRSLTIDDFILPNLSLFRRTREDIGGIEDEKEEEEHDEAPVIEEKWKLRRGACKTSNSARRVTANVVSYSSLSHPQPHLHQRNHPFLIPLSSPDLHLPKTLEIEHVAWSGGNKFAAYTVRSAGSGQKTLPPDKSGVGPFAMEFANSMTIK